VSAGAEGAVRVGGLVQRRGAGPAWFQDSLRGQREVIALTIGLAWAAQQPGGPSDLTERLLSTAMYGLAANR
jgi:hypothetical protein